MATAAEIFTSSTLCGTSSINIVQNPLQYIYLAVYTTYKQLGFDIGALYREFVAATDIFQACSYSGIACGGAPAPVPLALLVASTLTAQLLSTFTAFCMESFDADFLSASTQGGACITPSVCMRAREVQEAVAQQRGAIAAAVIRALRTVYLCD